MPEAVKPLPSFSGKSAAPRKSLAAPGLDHPEPGLRRGLLLRPWQKVRSDTARAFLCTTRDLGSARLINFYTMVCWI